MADLKGVILRGIVWTGSAQITNKILALAISFCLVRLLDPDDFGLLVMVMLIVGFADLLVETGLGQAIIQKQEVTQEELTGLFWLNVQLGSVVAVTCFFSSPFLAEFFQRPILNPLTKWLSLHFLFGSLGVVQRALLTKSFSFRRLAAMQILATVCAGAVAIYLAWRGAGVWALACQVLVMGALNTGLAWIFSPWRPGFGLHLKRIVPFVRFATPLYGFNVVNYWINHLDDILVGKWFGSAALGIYDRGYQFGQTPMAQIYGPIQRVLFPVFSTIQGDKPKIRRLYLKLLRMVGLVAFPLVLGMGGAASPFVKGVFGSKWVEMIPFLQLFCLQGASIAAGATVGLLYLSQGRTDLMFKWGLYVAVIKTGAILVGLQFGPLAVVQALLVAEVVFLMVPKFHIPCKLVGISFLDVARNLGPALLCSSLMAGCVLGLEAKISQSLSPLASLAVLVATGVVLYVLLIRLLWFPGWQEAFALFRDRANWATKGKEKP